MSDFEITRRQLFRGGIATVFAGKLGFIPEIGQVEPTASSPLSGYNPFSIEKTETLTKMVVDLLDEDAAHPNYFGRSAVRTILNEAAQPGADARQVLAKYFPDDAFRPLTEPSGFPGAFSSIDSIPEKDVEDCADLDWFQEAAEREFGIGDVVDSARSGAVT